MFEYYKLYVSVGPEIQGRCLMLCFPSSSIKITIGQNYLFSPFDTSLCDT